jgi:hypothetical protein
MTEEEIKKKVSELWDFVESEVPSFSHLIKEYIDKKQKHILIHQDAFAGDYQDEEFALLGKVVKLCGTLGISIKIVGTNREALSAEKQSNITRSLCNNGFCRDYNPEKLVEYKKGI